MRPVIKPGALRPGQTVGLVAPSFALARPETLDEAVASLEGQGYRVKLGEGCLARHGYFAGADALRVADINRMFRDDSVDAILCVRGGYGATRLLDGLDYDAIRANPKVFSGFSDITALHSAIREQTGLLTFHGLMSGDMAQDGNDPFSLASFWRTVGCAEPVGLVENPPEYPRQTIVPGRAEGPLIGGNLTLVTACLGTPYAYDFEGAVLFLEEIGEHTYAVDRMLTQLTRAGVLARVAGIVLGEFTECEPHRPEDLTLAQVFEELLGGLGVPVLAGIRCGHVTPKLTLPLGVACALDAEAGTLAVLEAAVV